MKRAAFLCIATATLLLFGLPSAPLHADTQLNAKSGSPSSFVAPGAGSTSSGVGPGVAGGGGSGGGGGGGGGTDEGDADGLSGLKVRPPLTGSSDMQRHSVFVEMWWKFMILWAR